MKLVLLVSLERYDKHFYIITNFKDILFRNIKPAL